MISKLKVGLIIDSQIVSKQIDNLIQQSFKSDLYDISYLIIQELENNKGNLVFKIFQYIRKNGLIKFIRSASFKTIIKIEAFFIKKKNCK